MVNKKLKVCSFKSSDDINENKNGPYAVLDIEFSSVTFKTW